VGLNPPLHTQHNEGNPNATIRPLGADCNEGGVSNTKIHTRDCGSLHNQSDLVFSFSDFFRSQISYPPCQISYFSITDLSPFSIFRFRNVHTSPLEEEVTNNGTLLLKTLALRQLCLSFLRSQILGHWHHSIAEGWFGSYGAMRQNIAMLI
jgi:hypothetical protein